MKAQAQAKHAALRAAGLITGCAIFLLLISGCAAERAFRFAPQNVSQIQYDPHSCVQMPDGKFLCKKVVFTVNAVDVASSVT